MSRVGTPSAGGADTAQLRVAFIAGVASGGTAHHVAQLAAGCRDAGLAVSVLAPAATIAVINATMKRALRPDRRDDGAPIATVTLSTGARLQPARDTRALLRLRGWLAEWQPDVVHAHGVRAGALAAAATAVLPRDGRPPLIVTVHNAPPPGGVAARIHATLEFICARRAALVWCASADLTARLRARGATVAEQYDVPAGSFAVPTAAEVSAAREELGAADRPLVVAAGRLAPQKGFDVLIEAAARWGDRDPRPVTVIAGDGPLAASLRAQAAPQADGAVRLLGHRDDIAALLAAADVVVVPSRWEARALIVQEAMLAGRPIVAARAAGICALTGDEAAVLVPPGDPAALAAAVTSVLDDPGLAARLGSGAMARAASFPAVAEVLNRTVASYARLAACRRPVR